MKLLLFLVLGLVMTTDYVFSQTYTIVQADYIDNIFPQFRFISFPSKNIGFACGSGKSSVFMKSTNGGMNWFQLKTAVNINDAGYSGLSFLNNDTGFLFQKVNSNMEPINISKVFKTTNGGFTWLETPETNNGGREFFFMNEKVGFFKPFNSINIFKRTLDGGVSWDTINIGSKLHPNIIELKLKSKNKDTLLAISVTKAVYYSTNFGDDWTLLYSIEKDSIPIKVVDVTWNELGTIVLVSHYPSKNTSTTMVDTVQAIISNDNGITWSTKGVEKLSGNKIESNGNLILNLSRNLDLNSAFSIDNGVSWSKFSSNFTSIGIGKDIVNYTFRDSLTVFLLTGQGSIGPNVYNTITKVDFAPVCFS